MATTRSFNSMLNEYLTYDLLMGEYAKRDYFMSKVEKDDKWRGGNLVVPFKGSTPSSFAYGKLTAESDISEAEYVRGNVSGYKEIWGTMKWNARDLEEHGAGGSGVVSEQSFLKNLLGTVDDFIDDMKQVVSVNLLNGVHFATLTASPAANDGTIVVDHPERFNLAQKVLVLDNNTSAITGYVKSININTKTIVLVTTRGGSTVVDFSGGTMTTGQNARCVVDGADTAANAFSSLRAQLLPASAGGDTNIFGIAKTAYPYLQATAVDGGASGLNVSASNILASIFDAWTTAKILGRCSATDVVMSYKHLGNVMKQLENSSGAYKNVETKASIYGYTEITVIGVKGSLKLVGVHEMADDVIFFLDWKAIKLHSNKFFRKQQSPEGLSYYTVRATTGYTYIVDTVFYGELVVNKPNACAVLYGIAY